MPSPQRGAAFSDLLQQLHDEHQEEVAELEKTISALRQTIDEMKRGPKQTVKPLGDGDSHPEQAYLRPNLEESLPRETEEDPELTSMKDILTCTASDCTLGKDNAGNDVTLEPDLDVETQQHPKRLLHRRASFESEARPRSWVLFDGALAFCILANIVFMFARLDYNGYMTAVEVGIEGPGKWPDMGAFFDIMQHVFCVIFLIELLCQLAVLRGAFFYSTHWEKCNTFDALLVVFTCVDLYIITPFFSGGQGSDLTVLRAVRSIRVLRALRVVRTVDIFCQLRVLLTTVVASFGSLVWSMALLFLAMLIAALILTQIMNPYFSDTSISDETLKWMFMKYGTASRSLWTFFEITFSGGWPNHVRRLVEEVDTKFAWFFALYVSVVVFAMTRIITALFLKDTLACAANDAEMQMQLKIREKKVFAAKLLEFFNAADSSGDGKMTLEEFESFLEHPCVKTYLATLDLEAHESANLFYMLDDGDGSITAEDFVKSALRLKGTARSQDVVAISHDFKKVTRALDRMQRDIHKMQKKECPRCSDDVAI